MKLLCFPLVEHTNVIFCEVEEWEDWSVLSVGHVSIDHWPVASQKVPTTHRRGTQQGDRPFIHDRYILSFSAYPPS